MHLLTFNPSIGHGESVSRKMNMQKIVGSPQDGNNYGAAYIYNLDQDTDGCEGDINGDAVVNVEDLLVVIAGWGSSSGDATDINQDGIVDVLDLLLLVAAWGPCE